MHNAKHDFLVDCHIQTKLGINHYLDEIIGLFANQGRGRSYRSQLQIQVRSQTVGRNPSSQRDSWFVVKPPDICKEPSITSRNFTTEIYLSAQKQKGSKSWAPQAGFRCWHHQLTQTNNNLSNASLSLLLRKMSAWPGCRRLLCQVRRSFQSEQYSDVFKVVHFI